MASRAQLKPNSSKQSKSRKFKFKSYFEGTIKMKFQRYTNYVGK